MSLLVDAIKTAGSVPNKDTKFPHAPTDWTKEIALKTARQDALVLGPDHREAARALQEYYTLHQEITLSSGGSEGVMQGNVLLRSRLDYGVFQRLLMRE